VSAFAQDVRSPHGRVTLLINTRACHCHGDFEEISLDDFRWLMNINFWGTVYGVEYFLPVLKRERRAHIVNLSSVFGIIAPAGQCAYSASKFAVRGFTEALRTNSTAAMCAFPAFIPEESDADRAPVAHWRRASESKREKNIERFERLARTPPEKRRLEFCSESSAASRAS